VRSNCAEISVIICAYTLNRWSDLLAAVQSVRAQTLAPLQFIVVIDYNDDLLAQAREAFPELTVVPNGGPKGLSGARNTGVALASAEIVAFLDDDAVADATWLEELAKGYSVDNVLGVGWQAGLEKALLQGHAAETVSGSGTPRAGSVSLTGSGRNVDSSPGASMFVRVADGCDRACAFCTIPAIRGPYRSRPSSEVVDEIRRLSGGRQLEVILLAQDLSSYGIDLADRSRLPSLIDEVCSLDEVRWLRLLYLQPEGVDRALLDAIERNPKVCRYFDIPFQHASESVLDRMGRPGDARSHAAIVESIRSRFPEAAVRTTVMVGYPGETEEEFAELERFVEDLRFDWMGAFRYSSEENTPAAGLGREVPDEVAAERYGRILDIQDFIEAERGAFFAGRELEVVVDGVSEEEGYDLVGRSYREAPVVDGVIYLRAPGVTLSAGEFVRAVVTAQEGLDLVGEVRGTGERGASRD